MHLWLVVFPPSATKSDNFIPLLTTRRYEYDDEELQADTEPAWHRRCHVLIQWKCCNGEVDLFSRRILQRLSTGIMSIECPKKVVRFL